jgi:hypothetical protein
MSIVKYVIVVVYGDFLEEARNLFCGLENLVSVDLVQDVQRLLTLIREKIPDLIIFYLGKDSKSYPADLNFIRRHSLLDTVPVYTFWKSPTREEVSRLLAR